MSEPLKLAARLDLSAASDLAITLKQKTDPEVVIDLSEVRHMGALCLQVLLAAATMAASEDRKISLVNATDRVLDQLRVMGMTPESIARGCQ